ncbi:uncharacterized protein LOC131623102 [Vicia villosa]|uniref:uncharacterized protein LOC131623102 n=1 Tax=Vicia villosa TaxID=3911 RepID=UPI00273B8E42|nr:uncharacterized protein LOC131623102 [Vicia villosa]
MKDVSEMSLEEDFLNLSQRKTIEELKDCQDNMVCVVLGTIKHVVGGNDWWYAACVCNKAVVVDSKRFFCPKCEQHVWTIVPRYRVKVRVIDETDSATFMLFDRDCYLLTKITCSNLIAEMDRETEPAVVQRVIGGFVDQTYLFKIDVNNGVNSGFEQSFCVKKVCADKDIITKFKSVAKNSVDVEDDLAAGVEQNDMAAGVVQNDMGAGVIQDLNSAVKNSTGVDENLTAVHVQSELTAGVVRNLSSTFFATFFPFVGTYLVSATNPSMTFIASSFLINQIALKKLLCDK